MSEGESGTRLARDLEPRPPLQSGEVPTSSVQSLPSPSDAADAFAWLEHDTTRTYQVSDQLLELSRERALANNGETQTFKIPTELLELARGKRLARQAAAQQRALAQELEADAPAAAETASGVPSTPDICVSELDDDERRWVDEILGVDPPSVESSPAARPAAAAPAVAPAAIVASEAIAASAEVERRSAWGWVVTALALAGGIGAAYALAWF